MVWLYIHKLSKFARYIIVKGTYWHMLHYYDKDSREAVCVIIQPYVGLECFILIYESQMFSWRNFKIKRRSIKDIMKYILQDQHLYLSQQQTLHGALKSSKWSICFERCVGYWHYTVKFCMSGRTMRFAGRPDLEQDILAL